MTETMNVAPHYAAAAQYMAHKGLGHLSPSDVEKVPDEFCWYFIYELAEGRLELEVSYSQGEWHVQTFDFDDPRR